MNKYILLLCSLLSIHTAVAQEIYLPNLKKNATGTTTGGGSALDVNVLGGSISTSEVAVAGNGSSLPSQTKVVSGYDGSAVRVIKTDSGGAVQVDVESSALPSGAATAANQTTANASLSSIDGKITAVNTGAVVVSSSALPSGAATSAKQDTGNTSLSSIDGKIASDYGVSSGAVRTAAQIGNATAVADFNAGNVSAQTLRTVIATDQSAIPASQSGTWNITNISGTVSLPTGAATSANQSTANTSLSSLDTKAVQQALNYGAATGAVRTAAQIGNATAVADFNAGNASAQTLRTVIATDQSAIPASQSGTWSVRNLDGSGNSLTSASAGSTRPLDVSLRDSSGALVSPVTFGTSGSQSNATVSTVITLTAPANAMGFLLTNLDTSTANIRWAVGATATASVGTQLQPGRDTGFIPAGANISVCAESGTQNYSVQWVVK